MIKIRGHTCVRSLFIKLNGKRDRSKDSKEECVFEETEGQQRTQMGRWRVDESMLEGWQMP